MKIKSGTAVWHRPLVIPHGTKWKHTTEDKQVHVMAIAKGYRNKGYAMVRDVNGWPGCPPFVVPVKELTQ